MSLKNSIITFSIISCTSTKIETQNTNKENLRKYELVYNSIALKRNLEKPFLDEFKSDASGIKIIPKIYILNNFSLNSREYFKNVENIRIQKSKYFLKNMLNHTGEKIKIIEF